MTEINIENLRPYPNRRGKNQAYLEQNELQKIDTHLNKLHDFVRVLRSDFDEFEERLIKVETWKRAHAATHGMDARKERIGGKSSWQEVQDQEVQGQPQDHQALGVTAQAAPRGGRHQERAQSQRQAARGSRAR